MTAAPRTTQRDIARLLGVHVTTVSMALRRHPSLPPATWERVRQAAETLRYQPDPTLSALTARRQSAGHAYSGSILGYLSAWPGRDDWWQHPAHRQFYTGASRRAEELGYKLEHFWLREPGFTSTRWNQVFKARNLAGLIVAPLPRGRGHLRLDWESFCAVKIGMSLVWPPIACVGHNPPQMMRAAIKNAFQIGYRRIALVLKKSDNEQVNRLWSAAFLDETDRLKKLSAASMHAVEELHAGPFRRWLHRYRPDVILGHHPETLARLREADLAVPHEVGFIDLDCHDRSGDCAGIHQNHLAVGIAAVDALKDQIQRNQRGVPPVPTTTLIDGVWHEGRTVRPRARASASGSPPTLETTRLQLACCA